MNNSRDTYNMYHDSEMSNKIYGVSTSKYNSHYDDVLEKILCIINT